MAAKKKSAFATPSAMALVTVQKLGKERVAHRKAAYDSAIKSGKSRIEADAHANKAAKKFAASQPGRAAAESHARTLNKPQRDSGKAIKEDQQPKKQAQEPGPLLKGKKGGTFRISGSGRKVYAKKH